MNEENLRDLIYKSLLELSCEDGINASAKNEVYGCVFGRDSALTILKLLKVHSKIPDDNLLKICKRALLTLISLQGSEVNIESGEEPGKFIHEYRKDNYHHLINREQPWYLYPEGIMKNYDSIDSTPLTIIAIYKYWETTKDDDFLNSALPAVEKGLNWIISYGDIDKDLLIEYEFHKDRKFGGLLVQSWTDSHESLTKTDGQMPKYPIAPIEAQGYAWLALRLWANHYAQTSTQFSIKLSQQANKLKSKFNELFIIKNEGLIYGAQALDGDKRKIKTITGNPLILLWASVKDKHGMESIVDENFILDFVERAFREDLFDEYAGIRTMSTKSVTFNPNQDSYHNGSFWPVLNGLIYEGLINWGFYFEAANLRKASLLPIMHFQSPIELYISNQTGKYLEYCSPSGQVSCKQQAWSAAATLDFLT